MRRTNKKAVSEVVAYVMLISITFALAGLVYGWLKGQISLEDSPLRRPDP